MKTFKEFIHIAERYYEPDEPLPSGKTPYGKATSSYYRQKGEYFRGGRQNPQHFDRIIKQVQRRNQEVSRGANNPNFNLRPDKSGRYDVSGEGPSYMRVRDQKGDVEMRIYQKNQISPDKKPVYDVEWSNYSMKQKHNPGEARRVVRDVTNMWRNQVAPRIPNNSVLTNFPLSNDTSDRNTRSKLYSSVAGFGKVGSLGRQYASVNRPPSRKQSEKGVQRVTPLSGDLETSYANSRKIDDLNAERAHKPKLAWSNKVEPRKIAPAKPSRPSANAAIKALKNTSPITAPSIPKPITPKPKLSSRIKSKLSGSLSNTGSASNTRSYTPGAGGRFGIGGVGLAD
jgi:hypothetical protein